MHHLTAPFTAVAKMKNNRKRIFLTSKDSPVPEKEPVPVMVPKKSRRKKTIDPNAPKDDEVFIKAPRMLYKGHKLGVTCVAMMQTENRDETLIFSGSDDKTIIAWSLKSGEKIAELKGHTQKVTCLAAFHTPGYDPLIISGGWDERLRIWPIKECFDHCAPVGEETADTIAELAELSTKISGESIVLRGHKNRVFGVTVIHSGKEEPVVASGSSDNTVCVWSLPEGQLLYVLEDERDDTWNLCISSWQVSLKHFHQCGYHGSVIITGCKNNTVRVWKHRDASASKREPNYSPERKRRGDRSNNYVPAISNASLQLSPQDRGKMSTTMSRAWSTSSAAVPGAIRARSSPVLVIRGHKSAVHSLKPFNFMDQPFVVTACKDNDVRVWSLLTGSLTKVLKGHTSNISAVTAFELPGGPEGVVLVSCSKDDATMRVWKYMTGECLRSFKGHAAEIQGVMMFPIPSSAPLGERESPQSCFNAETAPSGAGEGQVISTAPSGVSDAQNSRDDIMIVSVSRDSTMRSWLFAEEKALRVLDHGDGVKVKAMDVFSSPPNSLMVTGSDDGSLCTWHTKRDDHSGAEEGNLWTVEGAHQNQVMAVAIYTPVPGSRNFTNSHWPEYLHGVVVVSAARNGKIRLSSIVDGSELCPIFLAHNKAVTSLCVYPGHAGNMLSKAVDPFIVSGSEDHSARIWSMINCTCLRTLHRHIFDVTSVAVFVPPLMPDADRRRMGQMSHLGAFMKTDHLSGKNANNGANLNHHKAQHIYGGMGNKGQLSQMSPTPPTSNNKDNNNVGMGLNINTTSTSSNLHSLGSPEGLSGVIGLIDPIIVTGGMDDTIRLWQYSTGEVLQVLTDMKCQVLCVTHFTLPPSTNSKHSGAMLAAGDGNGTVWVWSMRPPYELLTSLNGHADEIQSLCAYVDEGSTPVLASASLDCTVKVWNLETFALLKTIEGHTADVTAVKIFALEGGELALASASADSTTRVIYEFLETAPQFEVVMQLFEFDVNGTNTHVLFDTESAFPRIALMSKKEGEEQFFGTYNFLFSEALRRGRSDFLEEFLPQSTIGLLKATKGDTDRRLSSAGRLSAARRSRNADLNNASKDSNDDVTMKNKESGNSSPGGKMMTMPMPDQTSSKNKENENSVGALLQASALKKIALTTIVGAEAGSGGGESNPLGILRMALERRDSRAVRCIVDCWCTFFQQRTSDLIYDDDLGRISMHDMILLSDIATIDFQKLICSIKLVPVKNNYVPLGSYFLFERDADKKVKLGYIPKDNKHHSGSGAQIYPMEDSTSKKNQNISRQFSIQAGSSGLPANNDEYESENGDLDTVQKEFLFLPIRNAAHLDMIRAYTKTCEELDSVDIFNSDVGKLSLAYAWRRIGIKVHLKKMWIYIFFIAISTVSLLTFSSLKQDNQYGNIAPSLLIIQLIIDAYFVKEEWQQMTVDPLEYMTDVWNCLDFVVITTNACANSMRLVYYDDNTAVDVMLCISSVAGYFNILYYLRAFEATGPLVSMILRISKDMRYLLFVLLIVGLGFSQAFWLLSRGNPLLPFSTYEGSLLYSFSFMLGNFDPTSFDGIKLYWFAIGMSSVYMIIVSILLLNLLIALMGDSYGSVKEKGLAQWKLEQAQIITEMQGSMTEDERTCTAVVYYRRTADDGGHEHDSDRTAILEDTIKQLKANQNNILRILKEQNEANSALREFIARTTAD